MYLIIGKENTGKDFVVIIFAYSFYNKRFDLTR